MPRHSRRRIVLAIAEAAQMPVAELAGSGRYWRQYRARFVAMVLMREQGYSMSQIGRALGNRDHTTVHHGLRRATDLIAQGDQDFVGQIARARVILDRDPPVSFRLPVSVRSEELTRRAAPDLHRACAPIVSNDFAVRARVLRRRGWPLRGIAKYFACPIETIEIATMEFCHAT